MKPNTDYNDMFNSGGMSFEQPPASLYIEHVDPISTLEQERDKLLNTLEDDKEVFLGWLTTINIKHISTLKMEMLELLVFKIDITEEEQRELEDITQAIEAWENSIQGD